MDRIKEKKHTQKQGNLELQKLQYIFTLSGGFELPETGQN